VGGYDSHSRGQETPRAPGSSWALLLRSWLGGTQEHVAGPALSPALLDKLALSEDEDDRCEAAYRPECPPATLGRLAHDRHMGVRAGVAYNTSCPPEVLAGLIRDVEPFVQQVAARNPNCPRHLLAVWQLTQVP